MAVKIRLKRLGKVRVPQYRIVVVDARKKRDGRVIEEIGKYHPKEDPSLIDVRSDRAQYWLGVGAQPSDAVAVLLRVTGDWQKFKGLPGAEGRLQVKEPGRSKLEIFNEALKEVSSEHRAEAVTRRSSRRSEAAAAPPRTSASAGDAAGGTPSKATPSDTAPSDSAPSDSPPADSAPSDVSGAEA